MNAPEIGPAERAALEDTMERSALDLETHQMKCVPCRTPGVSCGPGATIAWTHEDAKRALGLE
ncbi:hypothetical protein ACFT9I_12940 [Streptomyces sp. NPDC057137]|uniref:hypothetical protein n=1 Tax=Streptomyces sp. NPDC057137 TaxID=3346030 RepID=UPI003644DC5A